MNAVSSALQRMMDVLQRRPQFGLHDDSRATAHWQQGTRVVVSHANGTQLGTDMPTELGGSGDQVTPGWLFRAGLASCASASIILMAAQEGIELTGLDIDATSRSDTRGLLGVPDEAGNRVYAGPGELALQVRISARNASAETLRALVEEALRRSPVPNAAQHASPIALHIDVATAVPA